MEGDEAKYKNWAKMKQSASKILLSLQLLFAFVGANYLQFCISLEIQSFLLPFQR